MKRRLLIVTVFLLAGVVVNVAVAWGCAILIFPMGGTPSRIDSARLRELGPDGSCRIWRFGRNKYRWGLQYASFWDNTRSELIDCNEVEPSTDLRPDELAPSWAGLQTPPTDYEARVVQAFGWPVVSMWRDYCSLGGGRFVRLHGLSVNFLPQPVPIDPAWPGFTVNTLFYAAVLWLMIPGPLLLRRFIRVKRGLCPACAYPTGASVVCSECGRPLSRRAKVVT